MNDPLWDSYILAAECIQNPVVEGSDVVQWKLTRKNTVPYGRREFSRRVSQML